MLKEFYEKFKHIEEESLWSLWQFQTYETKFGDRDEIVFDRGQAILQQLPNDELSLLIPQTHERKVYGHAKYMLQCFVLHYLDLESVMELKLYGSAYQAVLLLQELKDIEVRDVYAKGTLEHVDRFNHSSEREVSKLVGVTIRHTTTNR